MAFRPVVGLGLCVVDHTYLLEGFDPEAVRTRFVARTVAAGGMTGTALCQVAALGCRAEILSVVGDDVDGRFLSASLRAAGVGTRRLLRSAKVPTTVSVVLVDRRTGERRFIVPDRRGIEARAPALDLSSVRAGTVLLVDGHFPDQALAAAKRAREVGATVIGDFHLPRPGVRRLLPFVDHAIVPMEFVRVRGDASARDALLELAERTGGRPVVTQGAKGGLYLEGRRVRRFRARRVRRVVDTTGAGDVFHGAFAAGLARGLDFARSLDLAAFAAARNCTALGGAGRLTTQAEMKRDWRYCGSGRATRGR
jgi:sulfofructose kinase